VILHRGSFADFDAATLYAVLRLRSDVFVVEQACAYPDLDGRDTEPATRHLWLADEAGVAAYLRVLQDGAGFRIGRVVTAPAQRGRGLAARLMRAALDGLPPGAPCVLHAQTHATRFYERFGFAVAGRPYLEDGIEHVLMGRPGA
jgi:ElaA protein